MDKVHDRDPNTNSNQTKRLHLSTLSELSVRLYQKMSIKTIAWNIDGKTSVDNKNNLKILPNVS